MFPRRCLAGLLGAAILCGPLAIAIRGQEGGGDPPRPDQMIPSVDSLTPETSRALGKMLEKDWKDRPEWGQMLISILKNEPMRLGGGWYRPSQHRYDWAWLSVQCDLNNDGRVLLEELPPNATRKLYFDRLDIDRDGQLTRRDFVGTPYGPHTAMAGELFYRLDGDSNGKVTSEELSEFFANADREERGFLTADDLETLFAPQAAVASTEKEEAAPPRQAFGLSRLVTLLVKEELGSLSHGPGLNEMAPDFTLPSHDGKSRVSLSSFRGKRPVVLIFGSFT